MTEPEPQHQLDRYLKTHAVSAPEGSHQLELEIISQTSSQTINRNWMLPAIVLAACLSWLIILPLPLAQNDEPSAFDIASEYLSYDQEFSSSPVDQWSQLVDLLGDEVN
jgi:hypothetical protein